MNVKVDDASLRRKDDARTHARYQTDDWQLSGDCEFSVD